MTTNFNHSIDQYLFKRTFICEDDENLNQIEANNYKYQAINNIVKLTQNNKPIIYNKLKGLLPVRESINNNYLINCEPQICYNQNMIYYKIDEVFNNTINLELYKKTQDLKLLKKLCDRIYKDVNPNNYKNLLKNHINDKNRKNKKNIFTDNEKNIINNLDMQVPLEHNIFILTHLDLVELRNTNSKFDELFVNPDKYNITFICLFNIDIYIPKKFNNLIDNIIFSNYDYYNMYCYNYQSILVDYIDHTFRTYKIIKDWQNYIKLFYPRKLKNAIELEKEDHTVIINNNKIYCNHYETLIIDETNIEKLENFLLDVNIKYIHSSNKVLCEDKQLILSNKILFYY